MTNNKANINFSIRLLNLLSESDNSVISPYGIAAVLSMAAEGASDDSLDKILATLGFTNLDELRKSLRSVISEPCEAFTSDNSIMLMKGKSGVELLDQFRQAKIGRAHV